MNTIIYTDGSCSPNPGDGGWAFVTMIDNVLYKVYGGKKNTTNNQMELTAVIESLIFLNLMNKNDDVTIYSDSKYTINCAEKIWSKKKNIDLWEKYEDVSTRFNIKYIWVKGHDGDEYNEMVDKLANLGRIEVG